MAFFTDLSKYIKYLEDYNGEKNDSFMAMLSDSTEVKNCLIQSLIRNIDGVDITFIAIRNIEINENYRGKKIFKRILMALENKGFPVMVDDIVNPIIDEYLSNRGYFCYQYVKNDANIYARYHYF